MILIKFIYGTPTAGGGIHQPIRTINLDTVDCLTCIILAIRYLVNPMSNNFFTFLVLLDSFSFFDCAEKGRPNRLPGARTLSNDALVRCDIKLRSISADNPNANAITLD